MSDAEFNKLLQQILGGPAPGGPEAAGPNGMPGMPGSGPEAAQQGGAPQSFAGKIMKFLGFAAIGLGGLFMLRSPAVREKLANLPVIGKLFSKGEAAAESRVEPLKARFEELLDEGRNAVTKLKDKGSKLDDELVDDFNAAREDLEGSLTKLREQAVKAEGAEKEALENQIRSAESKLETLQLTEQATNARRALADQSKQLREMYDDEIVKVQEKLQQGSLSAEQTEALSKALEQLQTERKRFGSFTSILDGEKKEFQRLIEEATAHRQNLATRQEATAELLAKEPKINVEG